MGIAHRKLVPWLQRTHGFHINLPVYTHNV